MEDKLYFEFLQIAIDNRKSLSITMDESNWQLIFDFCKKQSLIGIGFAAVEKLHSIGVLCPEKIRIKWMSLAFQIEKQNALLNEQCGKLTAQYAHDG